MKTDPRAYNGVLTAELADFAAKQGMDANDVYIYVCKNLRPKGDNMEKREHACDFVEFVDPEYVQRWVKNNVKYPEGTLLKSGGKTYCHIKYHGKYATAKELSELTGLRPNTIYVYWAKCEKDPTAFDMKIDRRRARYGDMVSAGRLDDTWEVAEQ